MDKYKIIELLKNDSIKDVICIEIRDSLNEENLIEVYYKNTYGNLGIITQRF